MIAVSELSGEIDLPGMILIPETENPLGQMWDGEIFHAAPEVAPTKISRQDFIDRWDFTELAALKGLTLQATQEGIEAATFWDVVMSRDTIDLTSTLAQSARIACQGWGILDTDGANRVFGY